MNTTRELTETLPVCAIHYGRKIHLRTKMSAWSNDVFEKVPFSSDPNLSDEALQNRIRGAIYKRFKPSHHAGCGYSCEVEEVVRDTPSSGHIVLFHYFGIGD